VFAQSWILVNTPVPEGFPGCLLEAHGDACTLLGSTDMDGVTIPIDRFVANDNFAAGLSNLLQNDAWPAKGPSGWRYIADILSFKPLFTANLRPIGVLWRTVNASASP
jgi:hypothetical protein